MRLDQLTTLEAIRQVLDGTQAVVFPLAGNKRERYRRVQKTLVQHAYWRLGKADKGTVTRYLMKVTGYSHAQIKRLIRQYVQTGAVRLKPALRQLFAAFPCQIRGFHTDNGSEYVNYTIARRLNKLCIEFTKSRPRHSNDNALVESKNGCVVRNLYGYGPYPATLRPGLCVTQPQPGLPLHQLSAALLLPNDHRG